MQQLNLNTMKSIIPFLLLIAVAMQAQPYTTIKNIADNDYDEDGVYYKDINNIFNNFEGTYLYNQNGVYLKFILEKKELSSMNGFYYEDMLVGGYQLKINNIEITNVLNDVNINYVNRIKHIITFGVVIRGGDYGFCEDCPPNEYCLLGSIIDVSSNKLCDLRIRKIIHNGQEAIKILISRGIEVRLEGSAPTPPVKLPLHEELILIKQP